MSTTRSASSLPCNEKLSPVDFFDPDAPEGLTTRQMEALNFINWYMRNHEYRMAPRLVDICEGMGLRSVSSAKKYVNALVEKGYLSNSRNTARGLTVTHQGKKYTSIHLDLMPFLKTVWSLDHQGCPPETAALICDLKDALRASRLLVFS